ncbi:MAG: substrate-binding domain-containing protein [Rhizobiaceae bacterium]
MMFVGKGFSPWSMGALSAALVVLATGLAGAQDAAAFKAKVDKEFDSSVAPLTVTPPTEGPAPTAGKHIVVIPCSMAAEGCARQARAVIEAAGLLGWKTTLIDPAGDNAKQAQAVQKAISIRADGIILASIDSAFIQGPLREARDAGIHIVAEGQDSEGLYEAIALTEKFYNEQGYMTGVAAYRLGGYKAHMILLEDNEFAGVRYRADGVKAFIEDCKAAGGDCKIVAAQEFLVAQVQNELPKQTVALVRQHPDFTALWAGYDFAMNFMVQGLQQADLADKGFGISFDANDANNEIIRKDGFQKATVGLPIEWASFGMVDNMNRLLAGQQPADQGLRVKLLTRDNMQPSGAWQGDIDFRAAYKKLWGVK